jgi:hypothetical protein
MAFLELAPTTSIKAIDDDSMPINWQINTLDFGLLSYFFIVLIGVFVSRLFKNYSEPHTRTGLETRLSLAFSAVIALIIFGYSTFY